MTTFSKFNLNPIILQNLKELGFETPTPIQDMAIPFALEGRDVLGSAQTGTGKTGAFGIPLIEYVMADPDHRALILTPTRELAMQVVKVIHSLLGKKSTIKTATLIGGEAMFHQFRQLQKNPQIIVGTPGRINDHLNRESLDLKRTHFIVLDEVDRMLDLGFGIQLEAIYEFLPKIKQTLMFSATLPNNIKKLANQYLVNPEHVAAAATNEPAAHIDHTHIRISESDKYERLLSELDQREGSIIVFVKTKYGADKLAVKLRKEDYAADALHGDLRQNKRERIIQAYRNSKFRILVATDVAARGLDIPHISHVINYDLPQCSEDYIHRIGRTARAGASGAAIAFVSPQSDKLWKAIERLLNPNAKDLDQGHKGKDRDYSNKSRKGRGKGRGFEGKSFERRDSKFATPYASEDSPKKKSFSKSFSKKDEPKKNFEKFERKDEPRKPFGKKPFEKKEGTLSFSNERSSSKPFAKKDRSESSFEKKSFSKDRNSENPFEKKSFSKKSRPSHPFAKKTFSSNKDESARPFQKKASSFRSKDGVKSTPSRKPMQKKSFGQKRFAK